MSKVLKITSLGQDRISWSCFAPWLGKDLKGHILFYSVSLQSLEVQTCACPKRLLVSEQ